MMEDDNYDLKKRKRLYKVPLIVSIFILALFALCALIDMNLAVLVGTLIILLIVYKSFINLPLSVYALRQIKRNVKTDFFPQIEDSYEDLFHIVLVPAYKEEKKELYEETVISVKKSGISDSIAVAFVLEQNDEKAQDLVRQLQKKYSNVFMIVHPPEKGIVRGKSSAMAYAGKLIGAVRYERNFVFPDKASEKTMEYTKNFMEGLKPLVADKEVVIHDTDIDFWFPSGYFEYFTYRYLGEKNRKNAIFQPIIALINNLDGIKFFSRNIALSTTYDSIVSNFGALINTNFSSYGISLDLLDRCGYWRADVIQEDSSLYWKVRTKIGRKNIKLVSLKIPIFGNAIEGRTWREEFDSQWKQLARWGVGTSDIADIWLSDAPLTEKLSSIPWWIKFHVLWETSGIIGLGAMLLSMYTGYAPIPPILFFLSYLITFAGISSTTKKLQGIAAHEKDIIFGQSEEEVLVEYLPMPSYDGAYPIQVENRIPTPVFGASTATALFIITESSKRTILWIDIGYIGALSVSSICALHGAYRAFKYDLKYTVSPK